jgi:maltooligosyltrehalose trehalohydrolase
MGAAGRAVDVQIVSPKELSLPLTKCDRGYFYGAFEGIGPGTLCFYALDRRERRPDPASRSQPHGVHGPSQVIESGFPPDDRSWSGLPLPDYVIYELHIGTYTPEGTFDAVVAHLDGLLELWITAVELMPVAQFPGNRNWGYDGVYPYAVQNTYGGPEGLRRLVNACHRKGLAVVLDVVYNHLGPEGNYLGEFGPYFTDRYRTPWGMALNFDGPDSDEVRRYFIENALYWIEEFHVDALRLDAVHAIMDRSPHPFPAELAETVHRKAARLQRPVYLMAEDDLNDVRLIRPPELGGYGLDAHWNDDFHHVVHAMLTGERMDFGKFGQLAKAFREGFVYSGQYSVYRRRRHGSSSLGIPPRRFVVFAQNHDQVGNRLLGDRLGRIVSFETLKLAGGVVILSPFVPLLFMGEEYGETAPFQYFVSHSDPGLIEAVRKGRKEEFAEFRWIGEPPDPQAEETFERSKLRHGLRSEGEHAVLFQFYRELLRLRKKFVSSGEIMEILSYKMEKVLLIRLGGEVQVVVTLFHFGRTTGNVTVRWPSGSWLKELDSAEKRWGGEGSSVPPIVNGREEASLGLAPHSFLLFVARKES